MTAILIGQVETAAMMVIIQLDMFLLEKIRIYHYG
jgi:hypothetical protein